MGRRKIEIKAIKDDRNRSVTFLKRKGGLFKKAHELSVLCSVDVAVIIFGHNKKLYEFSSGDINEIIGRHQYYGGPHERKGPADFQGKDNDDDDEEPDDAAVEEQLNAEQNGPTIQHPQAYPHMRPRASPTPPPHANGLLPHQYRAHTPQPHPLSRPTSRNHNPIPRPNSTLGHAPHPPNGYAYMTGPPHNGHMQAPHPSMYPSQHQPHPGQFHGYPPQPSQFLLPDQRRASMPPFAHPHAQGPPVSQAPHPDRLGPQGGMKVERQSPSPPQVNEPPRSQSEHLQPQPVRALSSKSKSIFTPIDGGSLGSWGFSQPKDESRSQETTPNKQSPDDKDKPVNAAVAGRPHFAAPVRTDSMGSIGNSKRPRLNLQIPSEHSDEEGDPVGESAAASGDTGASTSHTKGSEPPSTSHSAIVLPPPSPSALLSASASGPGNPFARPLPPGVAASNSAAYSGNNSIDQPTPISALPSRYLSDQMLPSPSSFYPDWGFSRSGGGDGNMLPSPLNFPGQTPIQGPGLSAIPKDLGGSGESEGGDRKRKTPEADTPGGAGLEIRAGKKVKAEP